MNVFQAVYNRVRSSVVGKLWGTIILLVALVLLILGFFLLQYIDVRFQNNSSDIKLLFVIVAIIGFCMSTFFAFILSRKIQQPLLQLKDAADSISQGDYKTRVNIESYDEIGQLAETFNHMSEQLDKMIHDLNHEKNHLSSILRSMGDSVITFDADGVVIMTNPSGKQLLEQWAELEKQWHDQPSERVAAPAAVPMPLRDLFAAVLETGSDQTEKLHVLSNVWSVVMAPLQSMGVARGMVAVIRNVTEEHKLEKLRHDFVANISHEIRTPLSMLQGYSEALLDDIVATPQERDELVQIIYDESVRMGRLANDLLDMARMEAGQVHVDLTELNLTETIQRVYRKFLGYTREQGISLELLLPDKPLWLAAADEDRMEQVLTNLLDNAIRHTPDNKQIVISAQLVLLFEKPYVELKVADEGAGIPHEDLPYVFERFYKADKARKRGTSGGTGLGLAIVKNIIELHRGTIQVRSEAGKGTTFTILLPVEEE